ncbi:MAG TPA: hypothetical protein VGM74_15490 [Burkholderiaceae bacterium]|jgi:hypothetical protein
MTTNLTWNVGDITVTRVVEMESVRASGGPSSGLPNALPEAIREISCRVPHFATPAMDSNATCHVAILISLVGPMS